MIKKSAHNKQFGVMAGERLRLNIFGLLKVRSSIEVYRQNPPQTPSCQNVSGQLKKENSIEQLMTFLYTARGTYDKTYDEDGISWNKYIEWSKLIHLTELVSLDGMLNEILVEPDYDNADDWNYIHIVEQYQTGFFATLDFVFKRLKTKGKFNLLTVVLEPEQDCKNINIDNYEFVGYDLLDQDFSISALTNCGGFDETFLPTDLNEKGLIDDFTKAYDIKKRILENNPDEHHADTNVIAVWRHKTIGR